MARIMAILGLLTIAAGEAAAGSVDLELVLLADGSRSIDDREIRLQRQGYAAAITHPEVLRAIEQGFDQYIAVTYVEWGDARLQDVVGPGRSSTARTAPPPSPPCCWSGRAAPSARTRSAARSRWRRR
jgi:hypothetical protein